MATKTFPNKTIFGPCCWRNQCVTLKVVAYGGSCVKNTRPAKPSPLGDTDMVINRYFGNASFNYQNNTQHKGDIVWVTNFSGQTSKSVTQSTIEDGAMLRNRALANFASGDIDLGMFAVEFRSTSRTVVGALSAIPALVKDFRKRAPDLSLNVTSKRGADNYLALNFGLKPLVDDVYGALNEFRNRVQVGQDIGSRTGRRPSVIANGPQVAGPDGSHPGFGEMSRYAVARGTVQNAAVRTLQELGLVNFPAHFWNALPLSFVVDWFIPVGDVLTGLTADLGMSGVRVTSVVESRTHSYRGHPGRGVPLTWSSSNQTIHRQVSSSPTAASSLLQGVQLSLAPDVQKLLTAAALYRQRIRGI